MLNLIRCTAAVAALAATAAAAQERPPNVLGPVLDALSGSAGSRQQATPRGPISSGVNRASFSYCTQLNRSGLDVSLAAAPLSDQARRLLFEPGTPEELFAYCADQINHHLCTREIVGLAGGFLTEGRGAASRAAGVGSAAQDAAEKRAAAAALFGGVVGGVVGAAGTGSVKSAVKSGTGGALTGYGLGSTAGAATEAGSCGLNRTTMIAVSDRFEQRVRGQSSADVDRFMQANARFVPAAQQDDLRYLQQVSQRLRQSAPDLWQRLNQ